MNTNTPLIILGSARGQSDTKEFAAYVFAQTDHHLMDLLNYSISPYDYKGVYPASDQFTELTAEMLAHDTLIFATPVYWYSMSGLMKTVFDRLTDLVTIEKASGRKFKNKHVLLIAVGADPELPEGFEIPFKNTAAYFEMQYKGCVYFSTDQIELERDKSGKRKMFIEMLKG